MFLSNSPFNKVFNSKLSRDVDIELISDYAKEGVEKLYSAGVVNGYEDGKFNPFSKSFATSGIYIILPLLSYH